VPKAKRGRDVVAVHPICHRTIHAQFSNAELARLGPDREAMMTRPAMAAFVRWICGKPPDFHAPTYQGR